MPALAPETIVDGRYQVVSVIGSGGMADVYCAQDLQLGRNVALKVLYERFAKDNEFVERFRREASAAAKLQHPNVVGVYDRGEWDGSYYIAMEFLEGRSLKQIIREEGPLEPGRAIPIVIQILQAARFAHQRGVIHRDIKPQNVIVDEHGHVKVTDFGIARAGASDMTETGSIMGTVQYLSPEQAQGHAVSPASDLYSVGIVLYELVTGRVPFNADSPVALALKQVSELPVPPSAYNPQLPPELDAVILHALEKDAAARFASADEFIAALQGVAAGLAPGAPGGPPTAVFAALGGGDQETGQTMVVGAGGEPPTGSWQAEAYPVPDEPLPPHEPGEASWRGVLTAAIVVLLIGAGILAYFLTRPDKVSVPDVVGQQLASATAVLRNQGFEVSIDRVTSDAPKDRVLREDPQPNSDVDKGSTISLTVSDGPGQATVPLLEGQTRSVAARRLREAGFRVRFDERSSDTIPKGRVVATLPDAGAQIDKGSVVTVYVSTGPKKIEVPAVTGQSQESATAELIAVGFEVDVQEKESQDDEPGTVLSQDPKAGSELEKGEKVTITVAVEPKEVDVPNVIGRSEGTATSTLTSAGLTVVVQEESVTSPSRDGVVIDQDPGAGSRVKRGGRVTITVGTFEPPLAPENPPPGTSTPP
jgi:serine/threonine-protein kinase